MEAYSLFEVNQYIRRVIALNFEEPIWIECEISSVSNSKGNLYLDLIQKSEDKDDIIAKATATIWYRQYLFIKKKLGKLTDSIIVEGIKVKMKAQVEFSERYGYSLNIQDIDPAYTFGHYEMERQKIISGLRDKELLDLNAQTTLPTVIQRIAVISSETAAGYQDFVQQLFDNIYGYQFEVVLFQSAMQGQKTEREVVAAFETIKKSTPFDLVTIIRGGGSKLDLSAFDNYNIAFEIATMDQPVITGIGHDIDQTVADMVAYNNLKTPTAVADFIIEHNGQFEAYISELYRYLQSEVKEIIQYKKEELSRIEEKLKTAPLSILNLINQEITFLEKNLWSQSNQLVQYKKEQLKNYDTLIESLTPDTILRKGFSLIKQEEKYITRKQELQANKELTVQFYDGEQIIKNK